MKSLLSLNAWTFRSEEFFTKRAEIFHSLAFDVSFDICINIIYSTALLAGQVGCSTENVGRQTELSRHRQLYAVSFIYTAVYSFHIKFVAYVFSGQWKESVMSTLCLRDSGTNGRVVRCTRPPGLALPTQLDSVDRALDYRMLRWFSNDEWRARQLCWLVSSMTTADYALPLFLRLLSYSTS